MIIMFEREVNFISVIRSIVRICLLSISTNALLFASISTWRTVPFESHNHTRPSSIQSQPQSVDLAQNTRTQNDRHVRRKGQYHTSDTFNCTNISLEQLQKRSALRFNLNMTNPTVRVTQSYMTTWYTATATECWLGSKIVQLKMIIMFEGEVNFIPVIRSIVQICLLSNSTNALLFISISTWRTIPFESPNHTWPHGIQSQPQSVDLAQ